ncbi:MAG: hypothetical protein Q7U82_03315 [Gammaproteobacteria bacterium]|nr:hypothetical protein [Gammaproteobacteria bacterium]
MTMRLLGGAGLCLFMGTTLAQDADAQIDELRKSVDIFAGVLREALGLNNRAGIFSPLNGSVQGLYLADQGVVLELVTPLSNTRSFYGVQSLSSSLQELSGRLSSLAATQSMRLQRIELSGSGDSSSSTLQADPTREPYRELLERLVSVDFSAEVETSLRAAAEAASSLNLSGHIDRAAYEALVQELSQLRQQASEQALAFRTLRNRISEEGAAAQELDPTVTSRWQSEIDALQRSIEPIREAARAKAQELREQSEQSRLAREEQWQRDLVAFEVNLFKVVCDYSAALRLLPEEEHLTLVLKGLGEETDVRREDRILVLQKADMQRCLLGEIASEQLQDSARSYSY